MFRLLFFVVVLLSLYGCSFIENIIGGDAEILPRDASTQPAQPSTVQHTIGAIYHPFVEMEHSAPQSYMAQMIGRMNEVFTVADSSSDIKCCVNIYSETAFPLGGSIGNYTIAQLASIDTQEKWEAITSTSPGMIFLTMDIRNIGGQIGGLYGISEPNTGTIILEYKAPYTSWAHEFGHLQGLDHHSGDPLDFMRKARGLDESKLLNRNHVSNPDCDALRKINPHLSSNDSLPSCL
ncbi:hypothetical protein KKB55_15870 [Myxococcota bacterium]|nr:hypothetical protein [Myxococcota bacterium]